MSNHMTTIESASFYILVPSIVSVPEERVVIASDVSSESDTDSAQSSSFSSPPSYALPIAESTTTTTTNVAATPTTNTVMVNKQIMKRKRLTMQDFLVTRKLTESSNWRRYQWTYKTTATTTDIKWWCEAEFCITTPKWSRLSGSHLPRDMRFVGYFVLALDEHQRSKKYTIYWASVSNAEIVVAASFLI